MLCINNNDSDRTIRHEDMILMATTCNNGLNIGAVYIFKDSALNFNFKDTETQK